VERNPWNVVQRYDAIKGELLKNPSVISMTGAMEEPGGQVLDNFFYSYDGQEMNRENTIYVLTTDQDFFNVMGIEPLAGSVDLGYTPDQEWDGYAVALSELIQKENFDQAEAESLYNKLGDYREKYILNETALKMLGIETPEEAIGKAFQMHFSLPYLFPEGEIVAVVPDFHYTSLHHEERPLVIAPRRMFNYNFLIRIDPKRKSEAIAHLNDTWQQINPEYPLEYSFISDSYEKVYTTEYTQSRVLLLFAFISILLSILGTYAMASFSMQRRTKEIGIRKVNGATIREIVFMLNKKFLLWVSIALVLAMPVAWYAMTRWLEGFAYKTDLSWWIFLLAGGIAIAVAMLTVSGLAYRAASRNPVKSIRYE
jgi:putative ABC transport system permease protein